MSKRMLGYGLVAVAVVCVLSFVLVSKPAAQGFGGPDPAAIAKAEAVPTPRMSDGHPSLTGFWAGGGAGEGGAPETPAAPAAGGGGNTFSVSGANETTRTADG